MNKGQVVHTGLTIEEIVEAVQHVMDGTPKAPRSADSTQPRLDNREELSLGSSREEVRA